MGKSKTCKLCGETASVHLTHALGGKLLKLDLCSECAACDNLSNLSNSLLSSFGTQFLIEKVKSAVEKIQCPTCNFTLDKFRKTGRLGCATCYNTFGPILQTIIKDAHGHVQHQGKVAQNAFVQSSVLNHLLNLEMQLKEAVDAERFEDAARYRDEIRSLKASLEAVMT
jgi:protein arginine kinase activator